jgi:hypothetical protein
LSAISLAHEDYRPYGDHQYRRHDDRRRAHHKTKNERLLRHIAFAREPSAQAHLEISGRGHRLQAAHEFAQTQTLISKRGAGSASANMRLAAPAQRLPQL